MNLLSIKNLNKTHANGVRAIHDVSLEIGNGMFGLLGPNGAGKSTLMKTIVGLMKPDSGQIVFNNTDILDDPIFIKRYLGFLPQDFGVYPKISAFQLLDHLGILKGITNKKARKEQILILLEKVNLLSHKDKEVYTFSGGMKQRFGIAQALLGEPKIVIVDEPTAGLDPKERNRFNALLCEISEDVIIILSTHLVEDVRNLCSKMAIINGGKVIAQGSPEIFIESLKGKIWQKEIVSEKIEQYESNHQIISSAYVGGKLKINVFSETPLSDFAATSSTLEDAYFMALSEINN